MAAKVRAALLQLSPTGDGFVPWGRLEEFFLRLEVDPKAVHVCKHLVDERGTVDTLKLFLWLYDGVEHEGLCYQDGRRLHYNVPACRWCVTRQGFQAFLSDVLEKHRSGRIKNRPNPHTKEPNPFHDDAEIGPNMHAVNLDVIKPRTALAGGMSWALMLNERGLDGDFFFVTHSWKEGVYEFSRKVLNHWENDALSMWCCFLANPQTWQREDLNELLGQRDDLMDSPFMQALSSERLHSFVVVPNVTESLYCRLWCVAELWKAMEVQKLRGTHMIHVAKDAKKGGKADRESIGAMIQGAGCSDANDEKRIRAFIAGNELHIQEMIKDLAKSKKGRAPKVAYSAVAHESGHAVYHHSQLEDRQAVPQGPQAVPLAIATGGIVFEQKIEMQLAMTVELPEMERRSLPEVGSARPQALSVNDERQEERASKPRALEGRILELRRRAELERMEELRTEQRLMARVEALQLAMEERRRSIVVRTGREREHKEALERYLRMLEEANLEELKQEIRERKKSAILQEETLKALVTTSGDEEVCVRLEKQRALRRQLETLEDGEGTDSVRRHLAALKQAELADLMREIEEHRREDEQKEQPMRQQLQELHEEWERFRAQCESERDAAELHEEQILLELEMLRKEEALQQEAAAHQQELDKVRRKKLQHRRQARAASSPPGPPGGRGATPSGSAESDSESDDDLLFI